MRRLWILAFVLFFLLLIPAVVLAQSGNDACLACHGNTALTMAVGKETVPLYVDKAAFAAGPHKATECVACHTDVKNVAPPHGVTRTYGGWARFSVKDDAAGASRNFTTAASEACVKCHKDAPYMAFAKSDHNTLKDMHTNAAGEPRHEIKVKGSDGKEYVTDENWVTNDCQRCHVTCATCHWKSTITVAGTGKILDLWKDYSADADAKKGKQSEFAMDWTVNVTRHEFQGAKALQGNNDLCHACHTGYYQGDKTVAPINVVGDGVRRHPQVEEMQLTTARGIHKTVDGCTDCHKQVHNVSEGAAGMPQCTDCHKDKVVSKPHDKVTCVGCHDDELSRGVIEGKVTSIAVKHSLVEEWPSHNLVKQPDCKSCHVEGNLVKAPVAIKAASIHTVAAAAAAPATMPKTGAALAWPLLAAGAGLALLGGWALRKRS